MRVAARQGLRRSDQDVHVGIQRGHYPDLIVPADPHATAASRSLIMTAASRPSARPTKVDPIDPITGGGWSPAPGAQRSRVGPCRWRVTRGRWVSLYSKRVSSVLVARRTIGAAEATTASVMTTPAMMGALSPVQGRDSDSPLD